MPTPDEVDANPGAEYGIGGTVVSLTRYPLGTYDGRSIAPGRWYEPKIGTRSLGLIHYGFEGTFHAFAPVSVGQGLGTVVHSLDEGVRVLLSDL